MENRPLTKKEQFAQQIYTKICFNPTINQKIIVEELANWLFCDKNDTIFILNGFAGTGKTTIIASFVAAIEELGAATVLLAPTGRAANVLARYSSRPAHTIHRYIYRESTNAQYESKYSMGFNRDKDVIFVVDEASMIAAGESGQFGSGSLLDDLVEFVRGGHRCRLMLVGDRAQLPPVGSDYSPALDENYMRRYGDVRYAMMDEVVRQAEGSGILHNATLIRSMMERGVYDIPKLNDNFPDVERLSIADFAERVQDCYNMYGRDETIIITRSNKRAVKFNMGVRRYTICAEDLLESGDMLMVVKNNYFYTQREKDCKMGFIANGDVARVERIRRFEDLYGFQFAECVLSFGDYDDTEFTCKIHLETLLNDTPALSGDRSQVLLAQVEQDYLDIGSRIARFKEIRNNEYFNALQVKYSYAVTCHKAQGGQWSAVFIDQTIFGEETMTRDFMRWLYTAVSRATKKVFFVGYDDRFF